MPSIVITKLSTTLKFVFPSAIIISVAGRYANGLPCIVVTLAGIVIGVVKLVAFQTSRKKELESLTINDIKISSRKYPYINFKYDREIGNDILFVENLTKEGYFENLSFTVGKDEKIGIVGKNSKAITMLYDILMGKESADSGYYKWGKTITTTYLPQNNDEFFVGCDLSLVDWLSRFSYDHYEEFVRGWLGRMLFSGEEALKKASVISGGEKVRCMLAKMMLEAGNFMVLDEPTNHLDLESITSLNDGLVNFKGCLLMTSHDRELMNTVCNRIIELDVKKVYDRPVDYDTYLSETVKK